jgi:hypothetical protein
MPPIIPVASRPNDPGGGNSTAPDVPGITGTSNGLAVLPSVATGCGVYGMGNTGVQGVAGTSDGTGVVGQSIQGTGVAGISELYDAIAGTTRAPEHAGVSATNNAPAGGSVPSGFALWATSQNTALYARGAPAGYFQGDVLLTGDMILVNSASGDIAEDFDVGEDAVDAMPGSVVVINPEGRLVTTTLPYDTRVAGVVSGAGELKPAVVLQRVPSLGRRLPIALMGKTFCKVVAPDRAIAPGDLLTTSTTPGHAMKADAPRAAGAILGKALAGFTGNHGLIPILVALR